MTDNKLEESYKLKPHEAELIPYEDRLVIVVSPLTPDHVQAQIFKSMHELHSSLFLYDTDIQTVNTFLNIGNGVNGVFAKSSRTANLVFLKEDFDSIVKFIENAKQTPEIFFEQIKPDTDHYISTVTKLIDWLEEKRSSIKLSLNI